MNRSNFSVRSLFALVILLGGSYFAVDLSGRIYYGPLCRRYAEAQRLTYLSHISGRSKWGLPAECFFRDRRGNTTRVEASTLTLTSGDWFRWVLSWLALIAGVGGCVWIASLVAGVKPGRRRDRNKKRRSGKSKREFGSDE